MDRRRQVYGLHTSSRESELGIHLALGCTWVVDHAQEVNLASKGHGEGNVQCHKATEFRQADPSSGKVAAACDHRIERPVRMVENNKVGDGEQEE